VAFAISAEAGTPVVGLEFALHLANRLALNWTACTPLQLQQICSFLWQPDSLLVGLAFIYALPI
jgi:hypothetical protein